MNVIRCSSTMFLYQLEGVNPVTGCRNIPHQNLKWCPKSPQNTEGGASVFSQNSIQTNLVPSSPSRTHLIRRCPASPKGSNMNSRMCIESPNRKCTVGLSKENRPNSTRRTLILPCTAESRDPKISWSARSFPPFESRKHSKVANSLINRSRGIFPSETNPNMAGT